MTRLMLPIVLAAAVLTTGAAAPTSVSPDGYGQIRVGMTEGQMAAVAPTAVAVGQGDDPAGCEEYTLGEQAGLIILTEDGRVARFTVYEPGIPTREGVQVGDPESKVRSVYGSRVKRDVAPYAEEPAHDLYVWRSKSRGLRFEVDDKDIVWAIHAGTDAIRLIEGCL